MTVPRRHHGAFGLVLGGLLTAVGLALIGYFAYFSWPRLDGAPAPLPVTVSIELPGPPLFAEPVALVLPEREPVPGELDDLSLALPPSGPAAVEPVGVPQRLVIPRIDVDSVVMSVGISKGEWPVPRFVVGHLAESAFPGEVGNSVFAGHLTSLTAGNVFARLKELSPGDELVFYGKDGLIVYEVTESRVVKNTDVSVLATRPGKALVTLITCEGNWIPRDNDYDQRRVIFAEPVGMSAVVGLATGLQSTDVG